MAISKSAKDNWESEINKRGGVSIEKQLAVPYTEEDSYAALIKTVDKINYGKIKCHGTCTEFQRICICRSYRKRRFNVISES